MTQKPARADLDFIWYADDHAYIQWSHQSSVKGRRAIERYIVGSGIKLGERTFSNQISISNDVSLDRLQEIADELDITLYNES